ncbi:MAG: sigma-70 family RNA polymerase sigma factor [Verrucomicrobiales bacterium]|nr:sigma-70 family RNA polymerase sigma factor [Verrucomicrobiales bacterium]
MSSKVPTDSTSTAGATPRNDPGVGRATGAPFATTHWTVVMEAGGADTEYSKRALEELCRIYWRPIYAYLRRVGNTPHDAQDLAQSFFGQLLNSGSLERVDPAKGRFRSFLLASLKHFMANEWDRARTLKRGGAVEFVSMSAEDCDVLAGLADASQPGPERWYDRQWALTLLDRVLSRLQGEFATSGKLVLWAQLRETLMSDRASVPYAVMAERLEMTEGAVKVAVHRLRQRYRDLLREEIAQTVTDPGQVDAELQDLFAALGS